MTRSWWWLMPPRYILIILLAASAAAASTSAPPAACGSGDDATTCAALLTLARAAHTAGFVTKPGFDGWRSGVSYCSWPGVACSLPAGSPFFSAVNASNPPRVVGIAFGASGTGGAL
jgi:hypothetical protein